MTATEISQRLTCFALCRTMAYENANFYHHLFTMTSLVSRVRTSTNNIFVNDLLVYSTDDSGHFEGERVVTSFPLWKSCWNAWKQRSHR